MLAVVEDVQAAFGFIVPLAMEGRWRMAPERGAHEALSFEDGAVTWTHWIDDADGVTEWVEKGEYRVEGGRLTAEFACRDGVTECRLVAAAPEDPGTLAAVMTTWFDGDADRRAYTLTREG